MNLLHERTRCIHTGDSTFFQDIVDIFRHTMRPYHYHIRICRFQFFFIIQDFYTVASQILDHFFIMDDRSVGKYLLSPVLFYLLVYGIYRTLHSEAESCCLCKFDIHIMQFLSLPTLSICTDLRLFSPLRRSSCPSCLQEPHPPPASHASYLCGHALQCHVRSLPDYSLPLFPAVPGNVS